MPPRLPRAYRRQLAAEDVAKVARIVAEAGGDDELGGVAGATSGGDEARLRGLPAVGRGVTGATVDTNPVAALMRKESRRRG